MLYGLGVIFYIAAALATLAAFASFEDNALATAIAVSAAVSSAFFGAMCMAANDIVDLLRRILGNLRELNNGGEALNLLRKSVDDSAIADAPTNDVASSTITNQ